MRKKRPFTIGYVGGLTPYRHIPFILKTAELLDSAYSFNIYGTGIELKKLLEYKRSKGLENVNFKGFAPEKELLKIYDGFDVFMCCSDVDGSSFPIEDALARGLPVIVAKENIYDDEVIRRVYVARTPKHAAEIIKSLRTRGYPKSRQREILEYAKTISWKQTARETEAIYQNVMKSSFGKKHFPNDIHNQK